MLKLVAFFFLLYSLYSLLFCFSLCIFIFGCYSRFLVVVWQMLFSLSSAFLYIWCRQAVPTCYTVKYAVFPLKCVSFSYWANIFESIFAVYFHFPSKLSMCLCVLCISLWKYKAIWWVNTDGRFSVSMLVYLVFVCPVFIFMYWNAVYRSIRSNTWKPCDLRHNHLNDTFLHTYMIITLMHT